MWNSKKYHYNFLLIILLFGTYGLNGQIQRPIGTNLAGVVDWSSEFVFVDVMNQSRNWTPHDLGSGGDWDSGVDIPLDINGYPLSIPYDNGINPPQGIRTIMFADLENVFPSGAYRVISEGIGTLEFWGAASVSFNSPIDTIINFDNNNGILVLEILESSINDPIHNISIVMPGYHSSYESEPFHPELMDFLDDFQVIRFMDWMSTNGSDVQEWSDRTVPNYFTQTLASGVSYEYLIELSNLVEKDIWINIPHKASDDFITQFAELLKDGVDPSLKIYIEYSNEVWNGIFPQNLYAAEAAAELGYTGEPWELSWKYTGKRSADVFRIFEDVFDNDDRLIKVIPGIAVNSWVNNYILDVFEDDFYNPTGVTADALAIAPYFGGVANSIGDAGLENTITVEEILDSMEHSMPISFEWMDDNKALADQKGLDLIAYEGGQHLVAYYPYSENEAFVNKLLDANRHPRMEDLYCAYFDYWYDNVKGGVFANFSSHGGYSKFGAWGVKETYEDINAPKYLGLKNCVFSYNSISNSTETAVEDTPVKLYPSIVTDQFTIEGSLTFYNIGIYDVNGVMQWQTNIEKGMNIVSVEQLPIGIYFVHITNEANQLSEVLKIVKY